MAGMLPGVECARRRRFYGSGPSTEPMTGGAHGWTRRPSFCLYISNNEAQQSSFTRNKTNQAYQEDDGKLGGAAREAKERLDERLRNQKKSDRSIRPKREEKQINVYGELSIEIFGPKKRGCSGYGNSSGSKGPLRWFRWKLEEQEDCAICLDRFNSGETLVHLPCSHRFHSRCLFPWLETNVHCPCCRKDVSA